MGKKAMKAELCLYGASHCGFGFLALGPAELAGGKAVGGGKMFGEGEPKAHWSATEAMWYGLSELKEAGMSAGEVTVFMPGGERMAKLAIEKMWPYFGSLKWEAAPMYVVSAEAVVDAAKKGA